MAEEVGVERAAVEDGGRREGGAFGCDCGCDWDDWTWSEDCAATVAAVGAEEAVALGGGGSMIWKNWEGILLM